MRSQLSQAMNDAANDNTIKAVIITGLGKYYSAGVDFAGGFKPMMPNTMREMVRLQNLELFDQFIDYPKPVFAAINGPAIGAAVTSATLCDGIIASEKATFLTPFKTLGLVPEGCSSYTYPKKFGAKIAKELLEGRKLDAQEALELKFVDIVCPDNELLETAQKMAEDFVMENKQKKILSEPGLHETLKKVNAQESIDLANAILSSPFLSHMRDFSYEKGKYGPYFAFLFANLIIPPLSRL